MATLFSLKDASFLLRFPAAGPQAVRRRVAAAVTLDGGDARDGGPLEAGSTISMQTELTDADLAALHAAAGTGAALGLSHGAISRAVAIASIHSVRSTAGGNTVTLEMMVAQRL